LPRKLHLAIAVLFISAMVVLAYVLLTNNVPKYDSSQNVINIIFKYGVTAKNELNTFEGTYTKDLIMGNTTTTSLVLSQEELSQIQQRMVDIDFFNYPENFPKNPHYGQDPQENYYIKVQGNSTVKEVSWNTNSLIDGNIQENLQQLANYITNMIEQKPEYKALPRAIGGYL
jgi:hypothetical protein